MFVHAQTLFTFFVLILKVGIKKFAYIKFMSQYLTPELCIFGVFVNNFCKNIFSLSRFFLTNLSSPHHHQEYFHVTLDKIWKKSNCMQVYVE